MKGQQMRGLIYDWDDDDIDSNSDEYCYGQSSGAEGENISEVDGDDENPENNH